MLTHLILLALALAAPAEGGGYHVCSDEGHWFTHHLGHPCDEDNLALVLGQEACYSIREPPRGLQCPSAVPNGSPECVEQHEVRRCTAAEALEAGIAQNYCLKAVHVCGPGSSPGIRSCIGDSRDGVDSSWSEIRCKKGSQTTTESCWE